MATEASDPEEFVAELQKQLTYWQKVLYLQDWTIDLKLARSWEMPDHSTLASCHWYLQRKDAFIQVLHPDDIAGVSKLFIGGEECDYDISLVHELLHLHFAAFHREEDETHHEQAINAISRGMVKMWRESNPPTTPTKPFHTGGHYI